MIFITIYLYLFIAACMFVALGWPLILAAIINSQFHSIYIILGGILLNVLWLYVWLKNKIK